MPSSEGSRRRSGGSDHTLRSSPDMSGDKSRGDGKNEPKSGTNNDSRRWKQWFSDVRRVLDQPTIALALFAIGVVFIIIASKQVKLSFDILESFGLTIQLPYGFLYYFMAAFVFMVVWLDVFLFNKFVRWLALFSSWAWSYVLKIRASMKEVENKERYHGDQNRKKRT